MSPCSPPPTASSSVHSLEIDTKSRIIARILGARHLTQAALSGYRPSPEVLAMGVWVDTVHALTALGLAVSVSHTHPRRPRRHRHRCAVGYGRLPRPEYRDAPTPASHQRQRDRLALIVLRVAPGGTFLLKRVNADRAGGPGQPAG